MEAVEGPPRSHGGLRGEDYHNNRRVFLRSYPLQWEEEDEEEEEGGKLGDEQVPFKRCLKERFLSVVHWGHEAKLVILRSLKKKVAFYVVACQPFRFKPSDGRLISLKPS